MFEFIFNSDFIIYIFLLAISGLVSGFVSSFFGVGGGIITVPIMNDLLINYGVDSYISMKIAVATSLSTMIPIGVRSLLKHKKNNNINYSILNIWSYFTISGSVIGSMYVIYFAQSFTLRLIFTIFIPIIISIIMMDIKKPVISVNLTLDRLVAFLIGIVSPLLGIGGGSFSVTYMVSRGIDIKKSIGTSIGVCLFIAAPSTLIFLLANTPNENLPYMTYGYVSVLATLIIVPFGVIIAPLGVYLSTKLKHNVVRILFSVLLSLSGIKMLYSLFQY